MHTADCETASSSPTIPATPGATGNTYWWSRAAALLLVTGRVPRLAKVGRPMQTLFWNAAKGRLWCGRMGPAARDEPGHPAGSGRGSGGGRGGGRPVARVVSA